MKDYFSHAIKRFHVRMVAFFVLGVATSVLLYAAAPFVMIYLETLNGSWELQKIEDVRSTYTMQFAPPAQISIPAVGIEASFEEPLGVNEDRTIEVPDSYEKVGWYQHGPSPGERGPAVILGHVDSYRGPAVFHPLQRLTIGDRIYIEREDGTKATFEVTSLENYEREGFPTELVYGDIDHAGLRLVTCSGFFDRGEQEYSHNLVVYARLIHD